MAERQVVPRWRAVGRRLAAELPGPRATPFTFWYLVVLLASTILLHVVGAATAHTLLAWSSTSSANLHREPLRVLLASALWVDGPFWWPYVLLFSAVLAPVERRVGSWRIAAIFLSGHVLATLVTELPIGWQVRHHLLPRAMAHLPDFGVSYGFFTVLGVAVLMLPGVARWVGLAVAELVVFVPLFAPADGSALDPSQLGHPLALHVGLLGWLLWARRRGLLGSLRWDRPPTKPR